MVEGGVDYMHKDDERVTSRCETRKERMGRERGIENGQVSEKSVFSVVCFFSFCFLL